MTAPDQEPEHQVTVREVQFSAGQTAGWTAECVCGGNLGGLHSSLELAEAAAQVPSNHLTLIRTA